MKTSITYLNHCIEIQLPADPSEDNTMHVTLSRAEGTYDDSLYNAYVDDYQYSATSDDPNQWLTEAIASAIKQLEHWGIKYYEPPAPVDADTDIDLSDIPY